MPQLRSRSPRRLSSVFLVLAAFGGGLHVLAGEPTPEGLSGAYQKAHQQAVNRQRRIIYNNDGAETAIYMSRPTREDFLAQRTTALVGTGVDSIFYCTRSSGFGLFTHGTKVGEVFATREGRYKNNVTSQMLAAGLDPLEIMVDYAHEHDIELFWSMRMNDTHDAQRPPAADIILRASKLKTTHPEYLLGTRKKKPKHGLWTAVNYARPEIRELAFQYFQEVCQRYDVDGIELDFFRHACFFPSNARGEPATEEELAAMTNLVRRIRTMTRVEGQKRGRPILVAVHCPDSVEYSRAIGLAIDEWMEQGLFDLWIAGGKFHLNDEDYCIRIGHQHGVKVYPSMHSPRVRDARANEMRRTVESYRARAANAWGAGADGVNLFNFFTIFDPKTPKHNLTNELGDPTLLSRLDRDYFASPLGVAQSRSEYPGTPYMKMESLTGRHPKWVKPGKPANVRLYVGDKLPKEPAPDVTLRLRFEQAGESEAMKVTLNGKQLTLVSAGDKWFECNTPLDAVRSGTNKVQLSLNDPQTKRRKLLDAVLSVRFSKQ